MGQTFLFREQVQLQKTKSSINNNWAYYCCNGYKFTRTCNICYCCKKGDTGLALGNVIGSNIANIILILVGVGLIGNIPISTVILTDTLILFVFTAIFLSMCYTKSKIERWEGAILLLMYFSYLAFAIVRNYCF